VHWLLLLKQRYLHVNDASAFNDPSAEVVQVLLAVTADVNLHRCGAQKKPSKLEKF